MDRRDFIKLTAVTGTSAALASCGNPEHQLIRFVPDDDITPGIAEWKPSVCPVCSAGCGAPYRFGNSTNSAVRWPRRGRTTTASAFLSSSASSLATSSAIAASQLTGVNRPLPRGPSRFIGWVTRSGWYVIWIAA